MNFLKNLSRRRFFRTTWAAAPLVASSASCAAAPAPPPGVGESAEIYRKLGVRTFINAVGTLTTMSGTRMPPEVSAAMADASNNFVRIHELQEKVGERIAELTGAEAGFVTAGASCSLCLGTCAVTAGDDVEKMKQLPDLTGMKSEVIIQKVHLSWYDHAFRMVGVKLVVVETEDEIAKAVNEKTAAMGFVLSHNSLGHKVDLETYTKIAHDHGLPVILDAAAEVPPVENLSKFVKMGVDMVAFSGGKNLRGPQCAGLLIGKKKWIDLAYANAAPNNYFARIAKVGKEEIVGMLAALELYLATDHTAERQEWHDQLDRVTQGVEGAPTVHTELITNSDYSHSPRLSVQWDEEKLNLTVPEMVQKLRDGSPSIEASDMNRFRPPWKGLGVFPCNLETGEEVIIAKRIKEILLAQA